MHLSGRCTGRSAVAPLFGHFFIPPIMPTAPSLFLRETVSLDLLVPLADNEGIPFSEAQFVAFERHVAGLTGGVTRRGDVEGIWLSPTGEFQREKSRAYVTSVAATDAARIALELDSLIRSSFRQLAAFIQVTPTRATVF
jgi:hypothetical protein